jgi:hypothetical protein
MPTLPSIAFSFTSKAGERLEWRSQVSVTQTGEFHCTFPDTLVDVARVTLPSFKKSPFDPLTIDCPRTQWQVQGPNLEECKRFLHQVAEAHLRTTTTVERILVYHVDSAVSYFRLADGTVYPNAYAMSHTSQTGAWQGNLASIGADHYHLGLFAQVLDRVTEQRGDCIAKRYEHPTLPDDSWGARLNSWTRLNLPTLRTQDTLWPSIPYTEPAAAFFYHMLQRLCEITDQLTTFLADSASVAKALNGSNVLALPEMLWAAEPEK